MYQKKNLKEIAPFLYNGQVVGLSRSEGLSSIAERERSSPYYMPYYMPKLWYEVLNI
jgi:hypothetical protein